MHPDLITPFSLRDAIGPRANYCLHEGYVPRLQNAVYVDSGLTDEFQREVYQYARAVAERDGLNTVCDVGCGSGYKLVHCFPKARTLGLDLPGMVEFLNKAYPEHAWQPVNLKADRVPGYQLAVSADVIEHLPNPDLLMEFLKRSEFPRIILSTPERDLLGHGTFNGPPKNKHHVREWNFAQLHAYIAGWFEIREHFVVEATQIVEAQPHGA